MVSLHPYIWVPQSIHLAASPSFLVVAFSEETLVSMEVVPYMTWFCLRVRVWVSLFHKFLSQMLCLSMCQSRAQKKNESRGCGRTKLHQFWEPLRHPNGKGCWFSPGVLAIDPWHRQSTGGMLWWKIMAIVHRKKRAWSRIVEFPIVYSWMID